MCGAVGSMSCVHVLWMNPGRGLGCSHHRSMEEIIVGNVSCSHSPFQQVLEKNGRHCKLLFSFSAQTARTRGILRLPGLEESWVAKATTTKMQADVSRCATLAPVLPWTDARFDDQSRPGSHEKLEAILVLAGRHWRWRSSLGLHVSRAREWN